MQAYAKKLTRSVSMFVPSLRETRVAAQLAAIELLRRPWRPDVAAVGGLNKEKPVIVDVGASRGLSVASMLMLKPQAQIIAFEPLADLADRLEARYRDRSNVSVFARALSRDSGNMEIFIPIYRGCIMDTLAALNHDDAEGWINSDRVFWFNKNELVIKHQYVDVVRLDDMHIKPDILKIYAQGHEPEVIAGGEATIRNNKPAILVPSRIPRIDYCLRNLGYARYAFRDGKFCFEGEGEYFSWYLKPEHRNKFIYPWTTV